MGSVAIPLQLPNEANGTYAKRLMALYTASGEVRYRDKVYRMYQYAEQIVIKQFATKYPHLFDEISSEVRYGMALGLETYNPELGSISSWLQYKMRLQVVEFIRIGGHALIPKKRMQVEFERNKKSTIERLTLQNGAIPSDKEVSGAMGMSEARYLRRCMYAVHTGGTVSLSAAVHTQYTAIYGPTGVTMADCVADDDAVSEFDKVDTSIVFDGILASALHRLNARELRIIALRYFDELPFRVIGERLEVSETRAHQLHDQLIRHIRAAINYVPNPAH